MIEIQDDTIIVDAETTRLEAFRMEDIAKAPVIILFIDDKEPQMVPLEGVAIIPVQVKSKNAQAEVQIISFDEVKATLAARSAYGM